MGENIGSTSDFFDILHEGHITSLKLCKKCNKLFVCLSYDKQIKRLKGEE
jgi:bifunctional ADP-heptose synthase (sugar kinase/adenylyltransferase)